MLPFTTKYSDVVQTGFWMIVGTLLFFWLPLLGPLLVGIFGGLILRSLLKTLLASIVPAIILVGIVVIFHTFSALPFLGVLSPFILGLFIVFHITALFVGGLLAVKFGPSIQKSRES